MTVSFHVDLFQKRHSNNNHAYNYARPRTEIPWASSAEEVGMSSERLERINRSCNAI